jgi:hypothetical protein
MLEPPWNIFYRASNYAGRLTNIKNKTPGESRAFSFSSAMCGCEVNIIGSS